MDKSVLESSRSEGLHRVIFDPMGISCQACEGQSIMEIAAGQNILLRSDCGSQGSCGNCIVAIHPAIHAFTITDSEIAVLSSKQIQNQKN